MSSHSTVLINSRSFHRAKEPPRSPVNGYFYKPSSSQNQQLLSKGAHHQLLPPALLRAVTPSSAGALTKIPHQLASPKGLFATKTGPTLEQHNAAAQPEQGSVPGWRHSSRLPYAWGTEVQPPSKEQPAPCRSVTENSSSRNSEYYGTLLIITQMCKCLQDQNPPVWAQQVITEHSTAARASVPPPPRSDPQRTATRGTQGSPQPRAAFQQPREHSTQNHRIA